MNIKIYTIPENEEIVFYLGKLLEKIVNTQKIAIVCSEENIEEVNKRLWTFSKGSFLPHGIKGQENENEQPVLLCKSCDELEANFICVLNENDLVKVADFFKKKAENHQSSEQGTIVFISNEKKDLNETIRQLKEKNNADIEIFNKTKSGWEKQNLLY